jgi:hypothetical protein
MPIAMSRPSKHPKTGIYQLRKVVPEDLRKFVGKREEKVSLQTRDPAEAKVRHPSKRLTSADLEYLYDLSAIAVDDSGAKIFRMEEWCLQAADDCLALHGLIDHLPHRANIWEFAGARSFQSW